MLAALINGAAAASHDRGLSLEDRGFQYGDGLFETALLVHGEVRFFADHVARLRNGCQRLGIDPPAHEVLLREVQQLTAGHDEGIVKIIVTRGRGGRGYRPPSAVTPTRIVELFPAPDPRHPQAGIEIRWCETRLARHPQLAGIKHLNRLEQVLAQSEWHDPAIAEGLTKDTEGEVISATSSNLFIVIDGILVTADLRYSGVAGIMRGQVLKTIRALGWAAEERSVWPEDIAQASEVFLTNAVRGIRPVTKLAELHWPVGPFTRRIANTLGLW